MARQRGNSNSNGNDNNSSWFKRHEQLSQFIINVALAALTLATLIMTSLYSNKSLTETQKSNTLAEKAYKLNKEQWDSLKRENKLNQIFAIKKDNEDSIKYNRDTTRISNRDKFQIESFKQQLKVYKQQLGAIITQAKIAKQQFEFQSIINKQQIYKNRPVFILASASYDSILHQAKFTIKNVGNTPSTIIRSTMLATNRNHQKLFKNADVITKSELNGITYSILPLAMDKWDFDQNNTVYYMSFLYTDVSANEPYTFIKYFTWKKELDNNYTWTELKPEDEALIKSLASSNRIKLRERQ